MKAAIDTNILVRIISNDQPALVKKANVFIKKFGANEIFVAYGVIWETYYVLKHFYALKADVLLDVIEDIMNVDEFFIENDRALRLAIAKARKGVAFYDALIGEIGALKNVKTYTFDKGLRKNSSFVVL